MQWVVLCGGLLLFACSSQDSEEVEADRKQCTRLRDHLVELRVASAGKLPDAEVAAHREAMTKALGDQFVAECQKLTSAEVKCGLAAGDLRSATACANRVK